MNDKQRPCDHQRYDGSEMVGPLDTIVLFNYCPWCGQKFDKSEPETLNDDCQKGGCED